jgi:hypothetical protein
MKKNRKAMKVLALGMSLLALSFGIDGCGGGIGQIISTLINLAGGGGAGGLGGLGGGGGQGPAAPEGSGGQGAPEPNPLPNGAGVRPVPPPQLPAGAQAQITELRDKYGIQLRGSPTEQDVANTLTSARHYRPENTRGLSFTFTAQRRSSGVLGVWESSGQSEIYSGLLDVVFHEMTHHITLFPNNSQSSGAQGRAMLAQAKQSGGGQIPTNCITRSYARTNDAEFRAEFFTGLASLERGLTTRFTLSGGTFNPPENVRAAGRQIWATN